MRIVIVGAGLAGLTCAKILQEHGLSCELYEAESQPGGRLRTLTHQNLPLDLGFQVAFDAYPAMRRHIDTDALNAKSFIDGAMIFFNGRWRLIRKDRPIQTGLSPLFGISDKLRTLKLSKLCRSHSIENLRGHGQGKTAEAWMRDFGFSETYLDRFARPFFGGIFLDRSLQVDAGQFLFVWKMLDEGKTILPQSGIQAIPNALAKGLTVHTDRQVQTLLYEGDKVTGVRTNAGEHAADIVVVAVEGDLAREHYQLPSKAEPISSTCLYFQHDAPYCKEPILHLNAGQGYVSHIAPVSLLWKESEKRVSSVTVLGNPPESDAALAETVIAELKQMLPQAGNWNLLRIDRIRFAQMRQHPGDLHPINPGPIKPGLFVAGEWLADSSINGAMESGERCANAILESIQ